MCDENKELINMLWEEWKYRNTHFWQLFYRFGFIILFVSFIPYVYPEIVIKLEKLVIAFPVAGGLLSIFAAYLLDAEAARFSSVGNKINEFRGKYKPGDFPSSGCIWKLRNIRLGYFIPIIFALLLVLLSILNGYVLLEFGIPNIQECSRT